MLSNHPSRKLNEMLTNLCCYFNSRLSSTHIRKEMKRLRLQFGHLPDSLQQPLHQLWQKYSDEGAATAVDKIAQELPGGWNNKQVSHAIPALGSVRLAAQQVQNLC